MIPTNAAAYFQADKVEIFRSLLWLSAVDKAWKPVFEI